MNKFSLVGLCLIFGIATRAQEPGRLMLSEDLAHMPKEIIKEGPLGKVRSGWRFISGKWEIADGVMRGAMQPEDKRGAQAVCVLPFQDAVFEFDVRLDGCRMVQFRIQDATPEHICRVMITRDGFSAQKDDHDHNGPDTATPFGNAKLAIPNGEWKTVRVEIRGERLTAEVAGVSITGAHPLIAAPKHFFEFIVSGDGASFRRLRVRDAGEPSKNP